MQDQGIGEGPVERDNAHDWGVLSTLLTEDEAPWTVDELICRRGDEPVVVQDSINRLRRGGLIRQTTDGLIYPTRAAVYFDQIHE